MAVYAQVENNVVVNMVVADSAWIDQQPGQWIESTKDNPFIIGCDVVNGVCVIPPAPEAPVLSEGQ